MRISDWSSDVCSSDLRRVRSPRHRGRLSRLPAPRLPPAPRRIRAIHVGHRPAVQRRPAKPGANPVGLPGRVAPNIMRIAIIPARGGSKRIKDKNIVDFRGKPMISYALAAARASGLFDVIHVSTDSERSEGTTSELQSLM